MSDPIFPNASHPESSKHSKKNDTAPSGSQETDQETRVYTAQFENLDHVRQFVREAAERCGLDEQAIYASQLAVDEAFSNIIEHAYDGESQEQIECTCQVTATSLEITLQDCGHPFDPAAVPDPDLEADLEERDIGGLGLFFIRQLMDEVAFTFAQKADSGKLCNVLRMVKHKES